MTLTKSTTLVGSTEEKFGCKVTFLMVKFDWWERGRYNIMMMVGVSGRKEQRVLATIQCCRIKQALPTTITGLRLCCVRSADVLIRNGRALLAPTGETAHYQGMLQYGDRKIN